MSIRQDIITEKGEIQYLTPEEVLYKLEKMDGLNIVRDRALISFLYLTGCRVAEAVIFSKVRDGVKEHLGEPIKKAQLFRFGNDKNKIEVMNVRNLKRRVKPYTRNIPIYINDLEEPFMLHLNRYLERLESEDYLFNFTRERAYQILSKVDLFPHLLRHTRMSHLSIYYNFDTHFLKRFTGWSDGRSADSYIHLRTQDLFNSLKNNYKRRG